MPYIFISLEKKLEIHLNLQVNLKAYFALNVKQLDKHYHSKIQYCLSVYFNSKNY
jgi:hypothetical protein